MTSSKKQAKTGTVQYIMLEDRDDFEALQATIRSTTKRKRREMCLMMVTSIKIEEGHKENDDKEIESSEDEIRPVTFQYIMLIVLNCDISTETCSC